MSTSPNPELMRDPAVRAAAQAVFECGQLEAMLRREFFASGSIHQSQQETEWRRTAELFAAMRTALATLLGIASEDIQVSETKVYVLVRTAPTEELTIYVRRGSDAV